MSRKTMEDNLAARTVRERLPPDVQRRLVEHVQAVCVLSPLVRPQTPNGLPMRVRVTAAGSLGWVGDGAYRYSPTDARGLPWPPMPKEWKEIADRVAGEQPWDCAIINWYDEGAALGFHRDMAEHDRSLPIVTISLGDAASWAVKLDERSPVHRMRLESGDVTLLCREHGTRDALHSIERIIPSPLLRPGTKAGRISITLRVAGAP